VTLTCPSLAIPQALLRVHVSCLATAVPSGSSILFLSKPITIWKGYDFYFWLNDCTKTCFSTLLFIYLRLLDNSISSSDYPALDGGVISELYRIWKESVVAWFEVGLSLLRFFEGIAETMRNLSQESRSPGRHSNRAPQVSLLEQTCPVIWDLGYKVVSYKT
jgi:hypothetical protein